MESDADDRVPPAKGWTLAEAARMLAPLQYARLQKALKTFKEQHALLEGDAAKLEPYRLFVVGSRDELLGALGEEIERRGLVAKGRLGSTQSDPREIGADLWPLWSEVDFVRSSLSDGEASYHAVRVYPKVQVVADNSTATSPVPVAADLDQVSEAERPKSGRPQKYPWEKILARVAVHLGIEGIPLTEMAMADLTIRICEEHFEGAIPDESTIRSKLRKEWHPIKAAIDRARR